MKLELKPGEAVEVTLEGTDGIITMMFAKEGSLVRVHADLPDTQGRVGVIYEENGDSGSSKVRGPDCSACECLNDRVEPHPLCPVHGLPS